MKRIILYICFILLAVHNAIASQNCFIASEDEKLLINNGNCHTSYAPCSTFKIALSLIGFDAHILKSENNPSWGLPAKADPYINACKGNHNPRTWMRDSCLWYSQILTNKIGIDKLQNYIEKIEYGNMDLSGGLTHSWISSSLKISAIEQIKFIQKIIDQNLPFNNTSFTNTKKIMFIQEMSGGWKLYGKTGNCKQLDQNGNKIDLQQGWFIGYIEKNNRHIVFASHITDSTKQQYPASFRARNEALIQLWYIIEKLEQ